MKVSTSRTHLAIKRPFAITEDHPVVPMAYSRPLKYVKVERGTIEYTWKDGTWVCESSWAINVGGTVLKKDGTESKNGHSRSAPTNYDEDRADPCWAWIEDLVDLLRPAGGVAMVSLENYLIGDVLG